MFSCVVIAVLAIVYNLSREQKHEPYLKVEFGDQIVLYWDPVFYKFVEDENFTAIFENLHNIPVIASFITNEEVVDGFVCGRKRALKKGDIAYLFLARRLPAIGDFNCLGVQTGKIELKIDDVEADIDIFNSNCEHLPVLLDYIERDRKLFLKRITSCMDDMFRGVLPFGRFHLTEEKKEMYDKILQDTIFKEVRQDIIKVEFGEQFTLYWDGINHEIVKDENYLAILKNKDNLRSMAHFITNEEIVYDFICSKKSALKKGDIAYLFLTGRRNRILFKEEPPVRCFIGIPFNQFTAFCRYFGGLLDYIEENRELVFQKIMSCLDNEGISR
jgi:hypothetical protein